MICKLPGKRESYLVAFILGYIPQGAWLKQISFFSAMFHLFTKQTIIWTPLLFQSKKWNPFAVEHDASLLLRSPSGAEGSVPALSLVLSEPGKPQALMHVCNSRPLVSLQTRMRCVLSIKKQALQHVPEAHPEWLDTAVTNSECTVTLTLRACRRPWQTNWLFLLYQWHRYFHGNQEVTSCVSDNIPCTEKEIYVNPMLFCSILRVLFKYYCVFYFLCPCLIFLGIWNFFENGGHALSVVFSVFLLYLNLFSQPSLQTGIMDLHCAKHRTLHVTPNNRALQF